MKHRVSIYDLFFCLRRIIEEIIKKILVMLQICQLNWLVNLELASESSRHIWLLMLHIADLDCHVADLTS